MVAFMEDFNLLIDRGGYVMIPLLVLSVVSLGLIIERAIFWGSLHRPGKLRKLTYLNNALRRGEREKARQAVAGDGSPYGVVAGALLEHGSSDAAAVEAVERQRPRLERFMVTLSTIITAAPLLGILGTVVGIIQSFKVLGEQTMLNDPKDVAAGIATALLTTAAGLIIALFTLFPYMVYRGQVDRAFGRLETLIASAQQGEKAVKSDGVTE